MLRHLSTDQNEKINMYLKATYKDNTSTNLPSSKYLLNKDSDLVSVNEKGIAIPKSILLRSNK